METKYKLTIGLVVVALTAIAISAKIKQGGYSSTSEKHNTISQTAPKQIEPKEAVAKVEKANTPTASVDAAADSIISAYEEDVNVTVLDDIDATNVQQDTSNINSLNEVYNENQF